jgi:hypothetical protein
MHQIIIERLRAEFGEMPGLRLTAGQVQRLCGVDETMCRAVLDALVDVKFLRLSADGTFARCVDEMNVRPSAAKASLPNTPNVREAS